MVNLKKANKKGSADFKRPKVKVGQKGKAQNATDTSFKAKPLSMSGQNIGVDKGKMVTQKNQTVDECIAKLAHPSASVRTTALQGIKELIQNFTAELVPKRAEIVRSVIEAVLDDEDKARTALLQLLRQMFSLGYLDAVSAGPYAPLIHAYILSGLTHLDPTVRRDALPILQLCVRHLR